MRIIVMNPKGGVGKTTIATNLVSYYLGKGCKTALIDLDPQGSSTYWVRKRPIFKAPLQLIEPHNLKAGMTKVFQLTPERGTEVTVTDTPAGMDLVGNISQIRNNDVILIPVTPSVFDIQVITRFIADLLIKVKPNRSHTQVAVIANRCRENTQSFKKLRLFLEALNIPFIGIIKDAQFYVGASEEGLGFFDLGKVQKSLIKESYRWQAITQWLDVIKDRSYSVREVSPCEKEMV
ncbi:ParA family protein [uncultured Endozoicomonas sp.]|uniref:ParA family protein n=1 Tax=uncultured Endozoicomonas sp. TaxID=432652 RepID=UPI002611FA73|nr:ParA family protein [uncultured Endozoicomonas sp.]